MPSVVRILVEGVGSGSGFFIDDREWIVTNAHVVGPAVRVTIIMDESLRLRGTVFGRIERPDLALIRLDSPVSVSGLGLAPSDEVRRGEDVVALGFPGTHLEGTSGTVTRGVVSAKGTIEEVDYLQTDAAINPGNSGGPLIDAKGNVIGINTSRKEHFGDRPAENIGYAIASSTVSSYLPHLMNGLYELISEIHVPNGQFHEIRLNVADGTTISYQFKVADDTHDIGFSVVGPAGELLTGGERVSEGEGSFQASRAGRYTILLDNSYSIFAEKLVILRYRVTRPRP